MTECERLIEEGVFSPKFFKEEVIDDFLVTTERKKVWAIEIDLLLQLDRVCRKHGLQYYLMFGSLLGAVRHNGFIPWDDDLDVCMPRADYEKLINIAPDEFEEPYFFQTPETDPGYYYTFAKLRNSNTAAFIDLFRNQKFNMGLLLDIFPLDVCSRDDVAENYKTIQHLTIQNTTYMRMSNHHLSEQDKKCVRKYGGGIPYDTYLEIQRIASQHKHESSLITERIVSVFTGYSYEKMIFNVNDLAETVMHKFHDFEFPIPFGYENVLKVTYGDYMKFPPVEERGTAHQAYIIDPNRSYREFYKEK